MDTELLKGTLSLLILSMLNRKPMYGYDIAATVKRDTSGALELARGVALSKSPQDGSRRFDRWEVGGKRNGTPAALLPRHRQGTGGVVGEGQVLDGAMSGREPHPGEIRWTSLSVTSTKSAAASADRAAPRQHIRQELREHLRDAAAEHKSRRAVGRGSPLRALADFGGPELVRSEFEATYGHRLLPVLIDRAMQWKEKTMRAAGCG